MAAQAVAEGLALAPMDLEGYEGALTVHLGTGRGMMRQIILKARQHGCRLVLPEGTQEATLRACRILIDEGIASPVLLGREEEIRAAAQRLGHELEGVTIVDPQRSPRLEAYAQEYLRLRARRGATPDLARARLADPLYFAALMVHLGDADMMVGGAAGHYADSLRKMLEVIGPAPGRAAHRQPARRAPPPHHLLPGRLRGEHRSGGGGPGGDRAALRGGGALARDRAAGGHALVLELRRGRPPAGAQGPPGHGDRPRAERRT